MGKRGARFGIVDMNGTRDLVILQSGSRKIIALKNRDPGSSVTKSKLSSS